MKRTMVYSGRSVDIGKLAYIHCGVELRREKREASKIAIDLCYPDSVVKAIWRAENGNEITRALITARHKYMCC